LFYLHWLSLIGFYFWFHPWWFDFVIFLLNSVLVLVIVFVWFWIIFLIDFFFNYIPKCLFLFNFYVKFGHNSFNCYFFIIIFLIGLFFSIPSQNILFYFIFMSNLVPNLLNCYLFYFALFFCWLFLSQFYHSIFFWLEILLLVVYGFVFNAATLVSWPGLEIWKTNPIRLWSFFKVFFSFFFACMFFDFLFTRSSKFHVFDLLTWVSCWVLSRLFFIYISIISADIHSLYFADVFDLV